MTKRATIAVENVNHPGQLSNVNAEKYNAMKNVLLQVIPADPPGITQKQMQQDIKPHLPQDLWPGGKKSMWWAKTVQLDLEAKGLLSRTESKPLTWHLS
ncbi:MAG: hypothetical protein AAF989_17410 [Planctomycetota bacterium]